jgi:phosphohistidine phosphatase
MKKIIFVRHARAEEASSHFSDFERSLTVKGKSAAYIMAQLLKEKENGTAVFVTSPAFRAYETAIIFARILGSDPDKIILKNSLYSVPTLNSLAEITDNLNEKADTLMLFGHNPSFTELPDRLSKNGCDFLPKCGIAGISFKTDTWKGIVHMKGKTEYFLKPEKSV